MSRQTLGKIVRFNPRSWWGDIEILSGREIEFHATCVIGATTEGLPSVGDRVRVTFSDTTWERLLSVEIVRVSA